MVKLCCPVCAGALERRAGAYLCPKNHSFDIAKSGYVNLLLNSSQGHHGDDKLMVRARRDFLDKGYYDRFIAAVADAAAEFAPGEAAVLDAGCGEGIYSLAVLRAIEKAGKTGELIGVDISKTAIQYAAKRSPAFTLCVASCAHLPVGDESVDDGGKNLPSLADIKALRYAQKETNQRVEELKLRLFRMTDQHMDQAVNIIKRWLDKKQ